MWTIANALKSFVAMNSLCMAKIHVELALAHSTRSCLILDHFQRSTESPFLQTTTGQNFSLNLRLHTVCVDKPSVQTTNSNPAHSKYPLCLFYSEITLTRLRRHHASGTQQISFLGAKQRRRLCPKATNLPVARGGEGERLQRNTFVAKQNNWEKILKNGRRSCTQSPWNILGIVQVGCNGAEPSLRSLETETQSPQATQKDFD